MTNDPSSARYRFEYPDQAGYPDGTGTLTQDQEALIDQLLETKEKAAFDISVVNEEENEVYTAIVGDTALGAITYSRTGNRIVLLAAAVYPEFRRQGVATEMIRRVLDDVRTQGKTMTIICPIVRTFIDKHPQYEDLVDANHPGVMSR
jgi:predicted GNAT family acetyltransferase